MIKQLEKYSQISFVGPGIMAEAIARNLVRRELIATEQIMMSGPNERRLLKLEERHGFSTTTNNKEAVQGAEVIFMSVKPQTLPQVMQELTGVIPDESLVISIVAGATLKDLTLNLDHATIVRCMPNTPAQIGEGITVWIPTPAVTDAQIDACRELLGSLGEQVCVQDEDYLDMATALSGTGPAYTFLFMEALVDAGVHLGFPRRLAEQLVINTVKGSVAYYEHSQSHVSRLRNQVTSPGGTSAEALYYLEKAGFRTALSRAIWAAYERSIQLGKGKKRAGMGASEAKKD
jgi:pyrroline-5-carboxylate reductase